MGSNCIFDLALEYSLYAAMEPCPMCFDAMVALRIRNLNYAAKDTHGGGIELNELSRYIRAKELSIEQAHEDLENFQLCLQVVFELERRGTSVNTVVEK